MESNFENSKRQGEWAELAFMMKAAGMGFTVCKPHGDSSRYDVITDFRGKLCRVQVKSALQPGAGGCAYVTHLETPAMSRYRVAHLDYFAVLVIPHDAWYIIPIRATLGANDILLHPNQVSNHTRFDKYRECWHLLMPATPGGRRPNGWKTL